MASKNTVTLRGDYITLAQALKVAGLVDSGGVAKHLIREGGFHVNGVEELQPGRKLRLGDTFGRLPAKETSTWKVAAEA
jgi:ribosome-associated protein YbcJ (S4-like RNA binding protein)